MVTVFLFESLTHIHWRLGICNYRSLNIRSFIKTYNECRTHTVSSGVKEGTIVSSGGNGTSAAYVGCWAT